MSEQQNNEVGLNEELVIEMFGREVANDSVLAAARKVVQSLTDSNTEVTLSEMVDAFDQVPELHDFSAKLRKVALSDNPHRVPEFWGAVAGMARLRQEAEA